MSVRKPIATENDTYVEKYKVIVMKTMMEDNDEDNDGDGNLEDEQTSAGDCSRCEGNQDKEIRVAAY